MGESRAREEDAFERAAAQLRPSWAGSQAPTESAAGKPSDGQSVAAAVIEAEPSVIIQPEIALLVEDPSKPQPEAAQVHSGYGMPSAFSRTETTVLTRTLPPGGSRALDPSAPPLRGLDPDSISPSVNKRARELRWLAVGGAACVVFGIVVALFRGSAPEPALLPTPRAFVAPVVQPPPAATPVMAAPSEKAALIEPASAASGPASEVAKSSANLEATPAAVPKLVREPVQVRGAKKKLAPPMHVAAKPAPAKLAKPTIAGTSASAKSAARGKVATKAAKNKPPEVPKRARSPVDVLNPWAN